MALGNTNIQSDHKLIVLKIKNKIIDKETGKEAPAVPHVFEVNTKVDGKWVAQDKYETKVSGRLSKIEFDKKEWDGNEYHVIKLFICDDEAKEDYLLDLRTTSDFRNLANSLLNLEDTSKISISLYKTTAKKNGKDYSNISLWAGNTLVKGKFQWSDLPKIEEIKDRKGTVIKRDTSEVDEFFVEKLKEFAKTLGGKKASGKTEVKADTKPNKTTNADKLQNQDPKTENIDEDVPF
jgi:hypothetical protein